MAHWVRGPGGLLLPEEAAPATPPNGAGRLWVATDGTLRFTNDGGSTTTLGAGGGGGGPDLTTEYKATTPAAPAQGVTLFTRARARRLLAQIGPNGLDTALQPGLFTNRISKVAVSNASTSALGDGFPVSATGAVAVASTNTNFYTTLSRLGLASTATASSVATLRSASVQWLFSNTPNLGGFFAVWRLGIGISQPTQRCFGGFNAAVATMTGTADPSTLPSICGFGFDNGATTWKFMHNDATGAATVVDLGANFPVGPQATNMYEFRMFCPSGGGQSVAWCATRLNDGAYVEGSTTTDLPALNTLLAFHLFYSNGATAAIGRMETQGIYIETDN